MYKLKYLKYKKKYLNLKNNLKGGGNDLQQNNIFMAVQNGDIDQVEILINNNSDVVNEIHLSKTPLFIAVETFNIPMINLLINRGADINLRNRVGRTVIHFFFQVIRQNIDNAENVLNTLIERGADVNIRDNSDMTSLMFYILFLKRDLLYTNRLTKSEIDSHPNLSNRFRIYNNILNILIENIQNLRRTILNEDSLGRTVFTVLDGGGYLDRYYIEFFRTMIQQQQQQALLP